MGKIYSSKEEYDKAKEKEFEDKCEMVSIYQGDHERLTLDGDWTEEELNSDVYDIAKKILTGTDNWVDKHKYSAIIDGNMIKLDYLVEYFLSFNDTVELYNKELDKHRSDEKRQFGIHYYDEEVHELLVKTLNSNVLK